MLRNQKFSLHRAFECTNLVDTGVSETRMEPGTRAEIRTTFQKSAVVVAAPAYIQHHTQDKRAKCEVPNRVKVCAVLRVTHYSRVL